MRAPRGRVVDVDRGPALRVRVRVGPVVHDFRGERDDGVRVARGVAAGAEAWGGLVWAGWVGKWGARGGGGGVGGDVPVS